VSVETAKESIMNPISRWRAALNTSLLTDATRATTLAGIEKVAPQSVLLKNTAVAAAYAAFTADGATFTSCVAAAAADEKQAKVSAGARDDARAQLDGSLVTLKTAVENNAGSAADVSSMGFENQCFQGHTVAQPTGKSGMPTLIS
jgi:hypothetical protein